MLAINEGVPYYGIMYMRLKNLSVINIINVLQRLLKIDQKINEEALIVVGDTRVRIRTISE